MTGTGRAMTNTPDREQMPPINLPKFVLGTISPYLKYRITSFLTLKNQVAEKRLFLKGSAAAEICAKLTLWKVPEMLKSQHYCYLVRVAYRPWMSYVTCISHSAHWAERSHFCRINIAIKMAGNLKVEKFSFIAMRVKWCSFPYVRWPLPCVFSSNCLIYSDLLLCKESQLLDNSISLTF